MGRGLSKLQKSILMIGARNRISGVSEECGGYSKLDIVTPEIMAEVYGWPNKMRWPWEGDLRRPCRQRFKPREIGRDAYLKAHVSVSRAMLRLQNRRLIDLAYGEYANWKGAMLTEEGLATGRQLLSVKLGESLH